MTSHDPVEKLPVLLINGYMEPTFANFPLKTALQSKGYSVFMLKLPFLNLFTSVENIGTMIAKGVDAILKREQVSRCDMIGVSLGGLTGLYYLQKLQGNLKVRKFIAYGAPLKGSWMALAALPFFGMISKSSWQMLPSHPLLKELNQSPVEHTEFFSLYVENDPLGGPRTAALDWTQNVPLPSFPVPWLAHQSMIFSKKGLRSAVDILTGEFVT